MPGRPTTTALLLATALALGPLAARGDAQQDAAETARLMQTHQTERYNVAVPGASIRAGGGMTAVNAPVAVIRQIVVDYGKYADYMPRFQRSRVVGKKDGQTDVYLQVPILHGAATVWAVTRFGPPVTEGAGERIEGRMVDRQGNVDDMRAVWHLRPVDAEHTILKLEVLIVPKLPLPGSVVTPELEFAADQGASATRDRAEARFKQGSKPPVPTAGK